MKENYPGRIYCNASLQLPIVSICLHNLQVWKLKYGLGKLFNLSYLCNQSLLPCLLSDTP